MAKIEFEKSLMDKIVVLIPGYGGYKKKENRRKTDKLICQKSILFFKHSRDAIDQLNNVLTQINDTELIGAVNNLRDKIDNTMESIDSAEYQSSTIFQSNDISPKILEQLANYDAMIITKAMNFQKHVEEVVDKVIDKKNLVINDVFNLQRQIEIVLKDFERRKDVMTNVENIEKNSSYGEL